jgi:hypothetical protein
MLTFDLVSLGQDLLGKALGEISLNLVQFLIKGEPVVQKEWLNCGHIHRKIWLLLY